jgi:hypothetical protein
MKKKTNLDYFDEHPMKPTYNETTYIKPPEYDCEHYVISIRDFFDKYQPGVLLDLNPITQRPPIYLVIDNTKSVGIISKLISGMSLGLITIVKNEKGEFETESLDGGHRKRAIHNFINNLFKVNGLYFNHETEPSLTQEQRERFLDNKFHLDVYEPLTNYQKGEVFRTINTTLHTPNHQEILNSFGDVAIANSIRETVREMLEDNHKLFDLTDAQNSKWIDVKNTRLKLEEFVARIYYRYYVNGFLGSRKDGQLMTMYSDEKIKVETLKEKVDTHLSFLLKSAKVKKSKGKVKLGWKELNTLSNLYHYLNEKFGKWTLRPGTEETFYVNFGVAFNDYILDPNKKYGDVFVSEFENADVTIKQAFKDYTTCHDSYEKQEQLMEWLVQHPEMKLNQSILALDLQRCFTKEVKLGTLALQKYICAIDGKDLKYDDAQAAHDIAYILGGSTKDPLNCKMVRKVHNEKMGTMTIQQYRELKGYSKAA